MSYRHSPGAADEGRDEMIGMPDWFKKYGYAATPEQKASCAPKFNPLYVKSAREVIALDYITQAIATGEVTGEALSLIVAAAKELDK